MILENIPIEQLTANPMNPRVDLDKSMPIYNTLKESILNHGYVEPIIFNRNTGMVLSGHQRLKVMKDIADEKGEPLTAISVITVDMDEQHQNAFMVAINRIKGLWDIEKLTSLIGEIDEKERSFTGFSDMDISNLLNEPMDIGDAEITDGSETPTTYNVVITYATKEEEDWLKQLLNTNRLKETYDVSEIRDGS